MPVETPSTHTATKTTGRIRQKNEEAILLAAAEEFAVHGYKGTSMNSIALRVGLPKANRFFSHQPAHYSREQEVPFHGK